MNVVIFVSGLLLAPWGMAGDGAAWKTRVTTGVFASTGDYGRGEEHGRDADTTLLTLPVSVRMRNDTWGFKIMVPWVRIDGPGNLASGDPGTGAEATPADGARSEGLGDIIIDATFSQQLSGWFLDWTLKTKCPTADEKAGLGTGTTDHELRVDLARRWGRWTGFGHVGYRARGDASGTALRDAPSASMGAQVPMTDRYAVGAYAEVRRAAREHRAPLRDTYLYVTTRIDHHWKNTWLVSRGFSPSSATWGVGTQIAYEF